MKKILKIIKEWTLPCAIILGTLLYLLFSNVSILSGIGDYFGKIFDYIFPFCVFLTLFTTFSKVDFHKMRFKSWHLSLIACQLSLLTIVVLLVLSLDSNSNGKLILEALLTCIIAPCAVAAPVVTYKLGGDINSMTAYTLISSLLCSITIPIVFPLLEPSSSISFIGSSLLILKKLSIVILLPLLLAWIVRHYIKSLYKLIVRHPNLSYYLWAFTLAITTGITVKNISHCESGISTVILIAIVSFIICIIHFILGRITGKIFKEKINCGQGMFQKNTGMAIWVSYIYLNPVASIGAGFYVLWQNIINSWEINNATHNRH